MAKPPRADPLWAVVAVWGVALAFAAALSGMLVARGWGTRAAALAAQPASSAAPAQAEVELAATLPPASAAPSTPFISRPTLVPVDSVTAALTPGRHGTQGAPHLPGNAGAGCCAPAPTRGPQPGRDSAGATPIGYSAGGRPLEVFRFGTGEIERMIVAGIHGGYEWNTIALAEALIDHLQEHPELIAPEVSLYILRALNPDGEARARGVAGHDNDHGVDLNRNWPSHWQPDWPRGGCWTHTPVTAGSGPGSEPETRALMDFLLGSRVDALISYHSAALGIFPGGQPPDETSLRLAGAVAAVSPYPYPPLDTGCRFTGQLIDWASDQGIAALDIELRNHRDADLQINLAVLAAFLEWRK